MKSTTEQKLSKLGEFEISPVRVCSCVCVTSRAGILGKNILATESIRCKSLRGLFGRRPVKLQGRDRGKMVGFEVTGANERPKQSLTRTSVWTIVRSRDLGLYSKMGPP